MRHHATTMLTRALGLLALAGTVAGPAMAQGGLVLENAWARRAPMASGGHGAMAGHEGMANGAVYVTVRNPGSAPDALVRATSDAARTVELHEVVNDGGVMRMRPIETLAVPAGASVEMKPGGYHVMLLGLTRDLRPGETVKVELTFERAGRMTIEAPVR